MKLLLSCTILVSIVAMATANEILLESFEDPQHHWHQMNDPVMGGKSTGTFSINHGMGVFEGEVVDVPQLKAPGFIKVQSTDLKWQSYPDVFACQALQLTLKSSVFYDGYRIGFGLTHPPDGKPFAWGYKADLPVPKSEGLVQVQIPFYRFTDLWDDATGDAIVTCKQDPKYCPTQSALKNMRAISVWAEGVAGKVHLEIQSISATGCVNNAVYPS